MSKDAQYARLQQLAENDPAQFRALMLSLDKVTIRPHAGQKPVLESSARFKVLNCGRRWGKTLLAAKIIVTKSREQDQMLWWVSPTYRVVKRGYAEVLKQLPPGVLAHDPPPESNFDAGRSVILRFKNGTRMEFYSSERPEGMLGAAVDFAVLDEAAMMKPAIFHQIVSPTLIDRLGSALLISTPRGKNWFHSVWLKGQDPAQTEWASWTFTTQDNPTLPPGEADRMAADMPRMEADQEIYAKWLAAGSSVFLLDKRATEDRAIHENGLVEGHERIHGAVFLGIDLARTNDYTVLYGTQEKDRRNVYFERMQAVAWSEQRRRIRRAVQTLTRAGAESVTLMVDEGNAGSVIVEDLEEAGYDVVGINFTTHKANMVRLLGNDLERGRAFVLDVGVSEFENYTMTMSPAGRMTYSAPEGQHDDIVSAKMLSHWGCVNEGFGDVTLLNLEAADQSDDSDPSDADLDGEDDFSDLVDLALDDAAAADAVGLPDPTRRPTPQELLVADRDIWF